MRHVLLTIDYEIFGNGSGDVRQHVVDPTERMARIAERYQKPLVIYVEVEEYLAFQRHATELTSALGYDPARLIRDQMRDLARRGHDVQLHIHPEWHGARLVNGRWQLDFTKRTVDSLFETVEETTAYLAERKEDLKELAGLSANHPVLAYRAGAFSAQPGTKLIPALAHNGFQIDSSVVHGLTQKNEHLDLDYRNAPAGKQMWRVRSDVAVEDAAGPLMEISIASVPGRRFHQLTPGRLKAKFSRNVPREQQSKMISDLGVKSNPAQMLKFLWQKIPLKMDFHNVAPRKLLRWIVEAEKPADGNPDVLVLIGHSKEYIDDAGFDRLLRGLVGNPGLRVSTFPEVAAKLDRNESPTPSHLRN